MMSVFKGLYHGYDLIMEYPDYVFASVNIYATQRNWEKCCNMLTPYTGFWGFFVDTEHSGYDGD